MRPSIAFLSLIFALTTASPLKAETCIDQLDEDTKWSKVLDCLKTDLSNRVTSNSKSIDQLSNQVPVDGVPIGTVIASVISPDLMQENNSAWLLADGRVISSDLPYAQRMNTTKLPDFRGLFLRGMNSGRTDQFSDVDKNRAVGGIQESQIPSHAHSTQMVLNGWPNDSGDTTRDGAPFYLLHPSKRGKQGNLPTNSVGGSETRPNNAAVFFYVKVR